MQHSEPAAAERDPEYEWLLGSNTGLSSMTIFAVLSAKHGAYAFRGATHASIPYDPSDLGRCLRLLAKVPGWTERLPEVAAVFPEWAPFVAHWDELEALYFEEVAAGTGQAPRCYAAMRPLVDEARAIRQALREQAK